MRFGNGQYVYFLLLPLAAALFFMLAFRLRRSAMERLANTSFLKELLAGFIPGRARAKAAIIVTGLFFICLALSQPQWGYQIEEVKRKGLDILIALDTSKSMLAEDFKPSRLERSKLAIRDMISRLKGDRVGLIAFAGTAFLQCPLTVDYNGFILSLDSVEAGIIPRGGTNISKAVDVAMDVLSGMERNDKVLIIITDGENHEGDPVKAAMAAKKDGITIYTIGIGSTEGELIPVVDDKGKETFLKDKEGNIVKTILDERTLQKIALATGGSYIKATPTDFGLDILYDEKLSKLEKTEFDSRTRKRYNERFQIPLAIGIILLMLEPLISERRRGVM